MRSYSRITPFFLAIQRYLVQMGVVPETCCQLALTERYLEYPQGPNIIQIMPEGLTSRGWEDGGGLHEGVLDGSLTFRIVNLNILDVATSDVVALHDNEIWNVNTGNPQGTTIGLYPMLDSIIDLLQMWDSCYKDPGGNQQSYLIEPMRLQSIGIPTRDNKHDQYVYLEARFAYSLCQEISSIGWTNG